MCTEFKNVTHCKVQHVLSTQRAYCSSFYSALERTSVAILGRPYTVGSRELSRFSSLNVLVLVKFPKYS